MSHDSTPVPVNKGDIDGAFMIVGLRAVLGESYLVEKAERDWAQMSSEEREHIRRAYRACYPGSRV